MIRFSSRMLKKDNDAVDDQAYSNTTETTFEEETTEEQTISAYFVLFSALLSVVLILSKLLHEYPRVASVLPEAGMILITGVFFGAIINLFVGNGGGESSTPTTKQEQNANDNGEDGDSVAISLLSFSPEVFFLVLLPPIIFNSGFHLRKELFFRHFTPICLFAVVGTTVSALVIATLLQIVCHTTSLSGSHFSPHFTELLTFGALLSATDPVTTLVVFQEKRVDPQLFYLVFGESVLNDAVGLVLFRAFQDFVVKHDNATHVAVGISEFILGFLYDSLLSPALGLVFGLAAALLFKHLDMRSTMLLELSLFVLIMYVPFLVAELLDLSGIVCILFTGLTARSYVVPNLSQSTVDHADVLFRLVSHLAESAIFLELGLSVFGLKGSIHWAFIGWTVVACLVARAANVYPIAFLYNRHLQPQLPSHDNELIPQASSDSVEALRDLDNATSEDALRPEAVAESALASSKQKPQRPPALELTNLPLRKSESESNSDMKNTPNDEKQPDSGADATAGMDDNESEQHNFSLTPHVLDLKISSNKQHMLWFSGLRGAVAYACVRSFPNTFGNADEFQITTMMIVLLSVFCLGSTTECMLNALNIEMNVDEGAYMEKWYHEQSSGKWLVHWQEFLYRFAVRGANTGHISVPAEGESPSSPVRTNDSDRAGELQRTPSSEFRPHGADEEEEFEDEISDRSSRRDSRKESVFDYGSKSTK